jgi:hypothetical protein
VKVVQPREYNPRFEADFNAAADYDFDRQRSEARKLQRQMVKEKRGAMRELRRDAAFMATVSAGTWCREWVWRVMLAAIHSSSSSSSNSSDGIDSAAVVIVAMLVMPA